MTYSCLAGQNYQLFVNGVLYKAPSIIEKGLPYFPIDILSEATRVRVISFSDNSVRLAGSPVDFVPVIRQGRPYLPAEAFAMASGSGVETDQTRGLVLYRANPSPSTAVTGSGQTANPNANSSGYPAQTAAPYATSNGYPAQSSPNQAGGNADYTYNYNSPTGPDHANPGVTVEDPGPEIPVAAPPSAVQTSPNTDGIHESVIDAMKTAEEITYAQRWLKHKMYWANQLDPANSPYLRVDLPPASPLYTPHPWATP